jgi:hypothetical protein
MMAEPTPRFLLVCRLPDDIERGLVAWPTGHNKEWACSWIGMTAEQAATILYQLADGVVDQRIPPPTTRTQ